MYASLWDVPWNCALLMSWRLNSYGFPVLNQLPDTMIETNALTASSGGIAENN